MIYQIKTVKFIAMYVDIFYFRPNLTLVIWYHLRALVFNFVICLFLGFYFKCLVNEDKILLDISTNTKWWWIEVLAIFRAMRWIWQNTVNIQKKYSFQIYSRKSVKYCKTCFINDGHCYIQKVFLLCQVLVHFSHKILIFFASLFAVSQGVHLQKKNK